MTPTAAGRRLAELEAEVAKHVPPVPEPEWMEWLTDDELTALELLFRNTDAATVGEMPEADQLRAQSIVLQAQGAHDRGKGATVSTDELLTAIEATSGDTEACFTALMSAAAVCMHNVLNTLPDEIGEQMGDAAVGFRVLVLADEPRVDLLLGDRFMPMASVSAAALARPRQ